VADAEQVEVAFIRLREASHALTRAQLIQQREAAGQQLMRVALVPHVEQQSVETEVKHVVQRDGQFDDAEVGCEVPAGAGDLVADDVSDFRGEVIELRNGQPLDVGW
jgi:hypothetical protein